ncbi:LLM class flavin-dependent oxidoreductase [Nocardia speluncae]|uniref:LLM class flavin-dependent oxidoreductase n=1 Tax=Nocardia speluncae TaxID=419477 RepID=A0A846XL81_9NOCA|nr:LLM class flavin-dependent oxidoreductase [Nocardia speluncae]NKY34504.1 LLM class flavin-dependent oxidoreductase [Nocardia speluncae]
MTEFRWELPVRGDGRHVGSASAHRGGFEFLDQVVLAAELSGLDGVVAPYDPAGEESWVVAGSALRRTRHLRVGVEFHPAFGTPVYAAKLSATLQRLSAGRLDWRLRVETGAADAAARGDRVTGVDRYRRAAEFLTVARGVWNEEQVLPGRFGGTGFEFAGEYYDVIDGGFRGILSGLPFPGVHLSGNSQEAIELSAGHGDVHIFDETGDGVEDGVASLRDTATASGRTVRAGLALPVIARETEGEAWARVLRQWREVRPEAGAAEVRALALDGFRWSGFDQIGYPRPVGLVGSYEQVAQALSNYRARGIEIFELTGHPHIEELHRTGEHLLHLADPAGRILAGQENHA